MKITSIILIIFTSVFTDFGRIAEENKIKNKAYDAYFKQNYEKAYNSLNYLSDSLGIEDSGIIFNKANSLYFLGGLGSLMKGLTQSPDSVRTQFISQSRSEYQRLWTDDNKNLSSLAYNQSGIIDFKTRENDELQTLTNAIDMFREALRKNPKNEEARYNYELLKRYKEYPDFIMNRVRELVKQRSYINAYNLLSDKVANDYRFAKQQEYLKRLSDIVKIETEVK